MQLTSIELPGKQIIEIEEYEVGKIHSSYVEGNEAHTFFKIYFDDFPTSFAKINRIWEDGVEGFKIEIVFKLSYLFDILKSIKIIDDEFGEQSLLNKVTLYKLADIVVNDQYKIEFDNADIRLNKKDFDNINTKISEYKIIEKEDGTQRLLESKVDCEYTTNIEIIVSEFKID